jgi:hypothetical protein
MAINTKLVDSLTQIIASLSEDERAMLYQRIDSLNLQPPVPLRPLRTDPFIGLWKEREDLADSTQWVRSIRQQHWTSRHGADAD